MVYLQEASQDEFVDKHRGSVGVVEDEGETQPVRNQVHRRIICQQGKKNTDHETNKTKFLLLQLAGTNMESWRKHDVLWEMQELEENMRNWSEHKVVLLEKICGPVGKHVALEET